MKHATLAVALTLGWSHFLATPVIAAEPSDLIVGSIGNDSLAGGGAVTTRDPLTALVAEEPAVQTPPGVRFGLSLQGWVPAPTGAITYRMPDGSSETLPLIGGFRAPEIEIATGSVRK